MDAQQRIEAYAKLAKLTGSWARQLSLTDDLLTWDSGEEIYQVVVDSDYCLEEWRSADRSFIANAYGDYPVYKDAECDDESWKTDISFLKDMFWAHFETIQILPE